VRSRDAPLRCTGADSRQALGGVAVTYVTEVLYLRRVEGTARLLNPKCRRQVPGVGEYVTCTLYMSYERTCQAPGARCGSYVNNFCSRLMCFNREFSSWIRVCSNGSEACFRMRQSHAGAELSARRSVAAREEALRTRS